jgi:hypothetical protein
MADLKQSFILKCLHDYNESVIATARATMRNLKVNDTGEGYNSFAYKVFQSGNEGAYSNLSFKEYLRFVDMGVGRGHPLGSLEAVGVELKASKQKGLKYVKDKTFKPKKIYAKIAYGKLPHLTGKLLYGFTDEAIKELKAELESNNNSNN